MGTTKDQNRISNLSEKTKALEGFQFTEPMYDHARKVILGEYSVDSDFCPRTVLDIGANEGAFTAWARRKWPTCTVTAYEPCLSNFKLFASNHGGDCNVRAFRKAVVSGDDSENVTLYHGRNNSGECSIFPPSGLRGGVSEICGSVSASKLESAEFVKLDTEGCELEILQSLDLTNTKIVCLEYHNRGDVEKIESLLSSHGFERVSRVEEWVNRGIIKFCKPGILNDYNPKTAFKKLFIGMPIYGGVDPRFFLCAMKLMAYFPVNCMVRPCLGDSLVPRARNSLTSEFLASDCTHMLMIDSDLIFSTEHIERIVSHGEDVVGGFYPKKKEGDPELVCNALSPQPPMDEVRRLTPMKYIGSGFLCISRRVFERMIEKYGEEIRYVSDHDQKTIEYDFWSVGVYKFPDGSRRYLSEDWYFCQRALDLGFTVYGDNGITLRHSGSAVYPLSYQEPQLFRRAPATVSSDAVADLPSPAEATALISA